MSKRKEQEGRDMTGKEERWDRADQSSNSVNIQVVYQC